jgi:hypothetical protein
MTAPINIEKIFPSFELLIANDPDSDTAVDTSGILDATQATTVATLSNGALSNVAVDDAGSFFTNTPIVTVEAPSGGVSAQTNSSGTFTITGTPVNGKKVTIDGTDITFGDVASGAGDVKTDIVGTSAVNAVSATGTITVSGGFPDGTTVTVGSLSVTSTSGTPSAGQFLYTSGNDNANASAIATIIDASSDYSATASSNVVTVTAATAGVNTDSTTSDHGSIVWTSPTLTGGVDSASAGDVKDDLAASLAQYIRANIADFSAEAAGAVVTVSYTGTNGTNSASPIGDTKTISSDASAINVSGATLENGAVEKRTAVVTASLFADTDATNRGTIESFSVVDGGSGYSTTPSVTLPLPNGNTIEKIGKLGADMVSGGGSFDYAKNYIAIALEDFNINSASGTLANPLSSTESAEDTGDYRKLIYHMLRKANDYLVAQESVSSIAVTNGGTGYDAADTVSIIGGGGEGATATLSLTAGVVTGVTVTAGGSGYTSEPSAIITTSTGSSCVLDISLSENTPDKFSISKGFLSENASTNEVTRDYTTSFTFDESGLEMAVES